MRIKKYIAASLKDGKAIILKDLGEDAVVLSSRTTKNPETGEDIVEIVAAIDDKPMKNKAETKAVIEKRITELPVHRAVPEAKSEPETESVSAKILEELALMKETLSDVRDNVKYRFTGALGDVLGRIYKQLIVAELTEETALAVTSKLKTENLDKDYSSAIKRARELAIENIKIVPPLQKSDKRKIAVFVGSSGSGKTSALVKIAVVNKLMHNSNILIVSADTYKVGGAEQLQTFASIAGIDFRSVYSTAELSDIIDREKEREYIFVDTTGRNHKNKEHISEINEFIKAAKADVIYLVQSATLGCSTFLKIAESFSKPVPSAIILTKLDEAAEIGGILSALQKLNIPLAYFTTGQQIPEDIEPASRKSLAARLVPDSAKD